MKLSLKVKLVLMFIIFISIPLIILGIVSSKMTSSAMERTTQDSMLLAYQMSTKNIINPIKDLEKLMTKAGNGDLTVRAEITTKDEIQTLGENFNIMIEHQSSIIGDDRSCAEEQSSVTQNLVARSEETSAMATNLNNLVEKFEI